MELQKYWDRAYGAVIEHGPNLLASLVILVLAIIVGYALFRMVRYLINRTAFGKSSQVEGQDIGNVIGNALFWITILVSLPAVLGTIGMGGLLQPMQTMAEKFLAYLPNLVGAGLLFGVGWMVATVVRRALTSVLKAAQADHLAAKFGLAHITGDTGISNFVGVLVFTLLIIPLTIAALDALAIESISLPAKQMLESFLGAIPNIFAAAIVLLLAYLIGRFASDALTNLLPTLGVDRVGERIGLRDEVVGRASLSQIASYVAFFAIMVFGTIESAKLLNFAIVSNLLADFITLGGHILLGSAIIVFGVILADFVAGLVTKSADAKPFAGLLKGAIIVLAAAMGLRQMGVANEIINTGFTLLLGSLAVGAAIAIGWGGKETAGRLLEKWTKGL